MEKFLKDVPNYIKGYIKIRISGKNKERFLSLSAKNGIKFWDVGIKNDDCFFKMYQKDFKKIRKFVRKTHTRVKIIKKCGLKNTLFNIRKRRFFLVGALLVFAFLAVSTRFIWSIEIKGASEEKEEMIKNSAELAGIKLGAYIPGLPNGDDIKDIILINSDDISWAWVYLKGTKAVIEVRENILPPKVIDKNAPCDIISARDGIITDIVVKKGIPFCARGDVVLAGDLLIGGTLSKKDGSFDLVHSLGEVWATTYHTKKAKIKLFREKRIPTGRKKRYYEINVLSKNIPLYKDYKIKFSEFTKSEVKKEFSLGDENYLGFGVNIITFSEEEIKKIPLKKEEAIKAAEYELEKEISKNLLPHSKLIKKESSYKDIDNETVEVTITMEFLEKTGVEVPLG